MKDKDIFQFPNNISAHQFQHQLLKETNCDNDEQSDDEVIYFGIKTNYESLL